MFMSNVDYGKILKEGSALTRKFILGVLGYNHI